MVCVSGIVVCVVCDGVWCGRVACDGMCEWYGGVCSV